MYCTLIRHMSCLGYSWCWLIDDFFVYAKENVKRQKKMTQWTHRAGHDSRLILKACSTLGAMQRLMTLENDGKLLFEICSYAYFQLYLHGDVQCFKLWLSRSTKILQPKQDFQCLAKKTKSDPFTLMLLLSKGYLILEGSLNLVPLPTKGAKSLPWAEPEKQ